jgi:hypothetical protein
MSSARNMVLGAQHSRHQGISTKKKREQEDMLKRGSTSFWMTTKKPSQDGKTCRNYRTSLLVRQTLNGATFLGDFYITTTNCITLQTRPICTIANGPFSRDSV